MSQRILVLDFGGQYKELIARAVRGLSVYSEIRPGHLSAEEVRQRAPIGIILTGGPNSVYSPDAPQCDPEIFALGIPVLGICYGMQLMCHLLGGEVGASERGEFGTVAVSASTNGSALFEGMPGKSAVLMSHSDCVRRLPEGFAATAHTADCPNAACENAERKLYGVQFHPEAAHSSDGQDLLRNFVHRVCGASGDYKLDDYLQTQIARIRRTVQDKPVLLGLSGGVDSSVCAALLAQAVPSQLVCIFVDHGFMRQDEGDEIEAAFTNLRLIRVNAQERFLGKLKGITEPEAKRKAIGAEFIRVFEEEAAKLGNIPFLAQGTIYPDVVESGGATGAVIKSHHNVGGIPDSLSFKTIIEPLANLFKDEVRALGKKLNLPETLLYRQPFPGPGLAIRIMGEVTAEKLAILRDADTILRAELDGQGLDQYFAVLTNTRSVGVKGDDRTYDPVLALRAVTTSDFMTCEYAPLPHELLRRISQRITSEIPRLSRVVYDITSKPPATVEWE